MATLGSSSIAQSPACTPPPHDHPLSEEDAAALARSRYGLRAEARALPGEYDDNFHLAEPDGPGFVLKVMHPGRDRGLVDLQCGALRHLAARAPHLALPRVVPTPTARPCAGPGAAARLAWCGC